MSLGDTAFGPIRAELDHAVGNMPWSVYGHTEIGDEFRLASFIYEEDAEGFVEAYRQAKDYEELGGKVGSTRG